ncbi:MFS transporter [Novosphingobium sp. PP1Y]|uniref:MFS transporter n=1 Tax=Novosphingobium sp. PP1Y TaxID=702113 RepID=UPI001E53902F|nr:MFS transporter [Novosphingobium sp. PP1Y]
MDIESSTIRKVMWRLLPLLFASYFFAYINRVNIGFALSMQGDLGLSSTIFGLGAGLFFISYFVCEIPSNLMLVRVGARRWIARIMITWGALSMCMALVNGVSSFIALRLLLGAAEAGFFPGVILYITYWFPSYVRARIMAWFMIAIPLSLAIAGPISNLILQNMGGVLGLADWRWLFILEGLPTVLLAFVVLITLPDHPGKATWLEPEQKEWLTGALAAERKRIETAHSSMGLLQALADRRTIALAFIYFANTASSYGVSYFLPQIIKGMGSSATDANYLSSIPFIIGALGIFVFGVVSDRLRQYRLQLTAFALGMTALGMAGAGLVGPSYVAIVLIALATAGTYGGKVPFWPLPSMFLTGSAAAGGIAMINSIGNLGGFVGPYAIGWVKQTTGSYSWGLGLLAIIALAGLTVALLLQTPSHIDGEQGQDAR